MRPFLRVLPRLRILAPPLLAAVLACARTAPPPASAPYRGPIVDVHLHAFSYALYGGALPNPVTGEAAPSADEAALIRRSLEAMETHRIVRAVASGPPELVAAWREAGGARLLPGIYLGELGPLPGADELRAQLAHDGVVLLGELGLQYAGLSPADPAMEPIWRVAEELDLPVALHTGLGPPGTPYMPGTEKFRTHLGNPRLIEEVLVRHPRLRVCLMHAGWPYLDETKAMLYMYPQLYVDVAVINWILPRAEFHAYLEALVRAGFGRRILFGSDQMIWPEAIGMAVEGVDSAPFLSPEQKGDIFFENAVRFFGWDEADAASLRARAGAPAD